MTKSEKIVLNATLEALQASTEGTLVALQSLKGLVTPATAQKAVADAKPKAAAKAASKAKPVRRRRRTAKAKAVSLPADIYTSPSDWDKAWKKVKKFTHLAKLWKLPKATDAMAICIANGICAAPSGWNGTALDNLNRKVEACVTSLWLTA